MMNDQTDDYVSSAPLVRKRGLPSHGRHELPDDGRLAAAA
jgi:hypothetical protein